MIERLLLDRVDAISARASIGCEDHLIVLARTDKTETALPLMELAVTRAHVALHAAVFQPMPILRGNDGGIRETHVLPP
jgi:hypothetical protein